MVSHAQTVLSLSPSLSHSLSLSHTHARPQAYIHKSTHKRTQAHLFGIFLTSFVVVLDFSVSGYSNLAIANAAGADITEADSKWLAGTYR